MNLKFDPVDVVGAGCWDMLSRLFLFITAIFIGCGIGSWSLHVHEMFSSPEEPLLMFLIGPIHLLSSWAVISLPLLLAFLGIFVRTEKELAPRWAGLAISMAIFCLCGYFKEAHWIAWPLCLLLCAMLATATWFFMQWSRNRWIQEMAELKAENQQRRLELQEKFGTVATNMYSDDET